MKGLKFQGVGFLGLRGLYGLGDLRESLLVGFRPVGRVVWEVVGASLGFQAWKPRALYPSVKADA